MMRSAEQILEEYLVAGARLGEPAAIAQLAVIRGPRLLSHATRLLGNREDARDAVQDAWVEILRDLPRLQDERAFPAWAYRIVSRRVARIIAKNVRKRAIARVVSETADHFVEDLGPQAADARAVRNAIKTLPGEQAAAISLFYLEDLSVAEVALALDIPVGTVKTRLMHARRKLNHALTGDGNGKT